MKVLMYEKNHAELRSSQLLLFWWQFATDKVYVCFEQRIGSNFFPFSSFGWCERKNWLVGKFVAEVRPDFAL